MTDENTKMINIRTIQHYMYCPRRWGLLEINHDWAENAFVVKANLMHERVHDGSHNFSDHKKVVRSSVTLYNDLPAYNLYGVADCIEFVKNQKGVKVQGLPDLYHVKIVEYKPKPPKECAYHETDAIQVFAQKICADFIWGCDAEGIIYYSEIKKRVRLPFDSMYVQYEKALKELLCEMRQFIDKHEIPLRRKGQKCTGCSMKEMCFYKTAAYSVKKEIFQNVYEEAGG
ncbi:MAG: Dna2/Cas4 domain-containing protein [Lachnospiraceae bacterium]|jgi:CRISPR-associated exonuclease Cas4